MPILISLQNTLVFEQPTSARPDRPNHFNYLEAVFNHNFDSFSLALYCLLIIPKGSFQLSSILEIDTSSALRPFPQPLSQLPLGLIPLHRQHFLAPDNKFNAIQPLNARSLASISCPPTPPPQNPHFGPIFGIQLFLQ